MSGAGTTIDIGGFSRSASQYGTVELYSSTPTANSYAGAVGASLLVSPGNHQHPAGYSKGAYVNTGSNTVDTTAAATPTGAGQILSTTAATTAAFAAAPTTTSQYLVSTGANAFNWSALPAGSGDVTGTYPALTVASGAITLAKMANLAANSIIGNNTGSPATPIALTVAQVQTLVPAANLATSGTAVAISSTAPTGAGQIFSSTSATAVAWAAAPTIAAQVPRASGANAWSWSALSAADVGAMSAASLTTGHLPKASGANALVDSQASDNGTTFSIGTSATSQTPLVNIAQPGAVGLNIEAPLGETFAAWSNIATHQYYAAQNLAATSGDFQLYVNTNGTSGWLEALRVIRANGNLCIGYTNACNAKLSTGGSYGVPKILVYDDGTYISGMGAYSTDIMRIFGTDYDKIITFGSQTLAGVFTEGARLTDGALTVRKSITSGSAGGTAGSFNLNGSTSGTVTHNVAATTASYTLTDPAAAPGTNQAVQYPSGGGQGTWFTPATFPASSAGWLHDDGGGTRIWSTPTAANVGALPSSTTHVSGDVQANPTVANRIPIATAANAYGWSTLTSGMITTALGYTPLNPSSGTSATISYPVSLIVNGGRITGYSGGSAPQYPNGYSGTFAWPASITVSSGQISSVTTSGITPVVGTASTNVIPKFTGASTLGASQISDDGTTVTIGTTTNAVVRVFGGTSSVYIGQLSDNVSWSGLSTTAGISSSNFFIGSNNAGGTAVNAPSGKTVI